MLTVYEKLYILYYCRRPDICIRISKFSGITLSGKDADNIGGDAGMLATKRGNLHVILKLVAVANAQLIAVPLTVYAVHSMIG